MKSPRNEWLIVRDTVRLTEIIDPVIVELDAYFKEANLKAYVTSGLRTSKDQLTIIKNYLVRKKLDDDYPESAFCEEVHKKIEWKGKDVYQWQPGWSALLNAGVIINPPLPAECLMDYFRDGKNKKGDVIGSSPHFNGVCFDVGGGADGIEQEIAVIKSAMGKVKGMRGYLAEHANNAVHIDCIKT